MKTTITKQVVEIDYTVVNILEASSGPIVLNDPGQIPADPDAFYGTFQYHSNPLLIGQCLLHNKGDYNLAVDTIILSYTND